MATATLEVMRIPEVVTIGEFNFDWILFPDLTGFFSNEEFDVLFGCITNRPGVYYFYNNESREISYVGCTENRGIRARIDQYRTPGGTRSSGRNFWKGFQKKHPCSSFDDFKTHVRSLRLETLSTTLNNERQAELTAANKGIEDFLICKLQPIYNSPCNSGLTDDEQDSLMSALLEDAPGKRLKHLETDG